MRETDHPLDGTRTSVDWRSSPVSVAVWPVGAFEQHGARLPLLTDTLLAEHFARDLARRLPAALLPALPFASSVEHAGFRGTLYLRPETLMQIVRDLAECLERQAFTRLVIVNGHGGNFFLGPVVRHHNALDRPLKIVLADCGRELDRTSPARGLYRDGELHAGASEVSRLLALRPELVRPAAVSAADGAAAAPRAGFERGDLNTFGIGCRHPSGVWGDAAGGDAAAGAAMVAGIADGLLEHVRERLAWLDRDPRYAGAAGDDGDGHRRGEP